MDTEMKVIRVETRTLPTNLTPDELMDRSQELAAVTQEINAEEDSQKNLKDQMKAKMSELHSKQSRLALVVTRRQDLREVEVEVRFDGTQVNESRKDTGEIIMTRPLRDTERQMILAQDGPRKIGLGEAIVETIKDVVEDHQATIDGAAPSPFDSTP